MNQYFKTNNSHPLFKWYLVGPERCSGLFNFFASLPHQNLLGFERTPQYSGGRTARSADGIRRRVNAAVLAKTFANPAPRRKKVEADEPLLHETDQMEWSSTTAPAEIQVDEKSLGEKTVSEGSSQIIITDGPTEATFPDLEVKAGTKQWFLSRFWISVWGGVAAAVFLFIILSTVFARTTVYLKPRVENLSLQDVRVAFDISVSRVLVPQKVVPAEALEFKKVFSAEFISSGREFVTEKARGRVLIYNGFSSSPQALVQNTRFLTDSGLLYRLAKATVIPGAKIENGKIVPQSVEVELAADQAGEDSNVPHEVTLRIPGFQGSPKYEGFYARAPAGFTGGFKGEASVVTAQDLKKSQEEVSKNAFDELQKDLLIKVPPDFKFLETMREIEILKVSAPRVNYQAEKFRVEVEARARAIVFREGDFLSLLAELILKDESGKKFMVGSQKFNYYVRNIDFNKGRVEASLSGDIKASSMVNTESLGGEILGKKEGSLVEFLKGQGSLASFRISFFPPWTSRVPTSREKVKLVVEDP